MNWGTKIFLTFVVFAIIIMSMVAISVSQDFHLVSEDYYKQEIEYQDQIDKIQNYKQLEQPLAIKYWSKGRKASIQFPTSRKAELEGEIHFFRPSNGNLDFKVAINPDGGGSQIVDLSDAVPGLWKVKVSWSANGKGYYDEQTLVL
ncbi:MAG: FixH family protein [Bacteroidota bacterium]